MFKFKSTFLPLAIVAVIQFSACSSTQLHKQIPQSKHQTVEENIVLAMQKIPEVPRIAVSVYAEDFVFSKGFGITSVNTREATSGDTAFYIASSTKSITALAMANLHEKGVIDLDTSIASFAPDAPFKPEIETHEITLRHLLAQSSGIKNAPIAHRLAFTGNHTPSQLWDALAFTENNQDEPRGSFKYSNYNFNILTLLTDKKLRRSWKDIVAKEIFDKAGMTRTTAYVSIAKANGWSMARPHQLNVGGVSQIKLEKQDNTMQSAGGVLMSANDAALWLELLIEQGKVGMRQVLPAKAVLATQKFETEVDKTFLGFKRKYYGLGFYGGQYGEKNDLMLHHFGSFAGSSSHISYLPLKKVGVAIFTNEDAIGIRLASVLSRYIYSELANDANASNTLKKDIRQLAEQIVKRREQLQHAKKRQAERQYQLTQPLANYMGTYSNQMYGKITVGKSNEHLLVSSGNLSAVSTAYPKKDSVRIEMTPGTGQILSFKLDEGKEIESLTVSDVVYIKVIE